MAAARCAWFLGLSLMTWQAGAATPIYRSVGPGNTLPLATGGGNALVLAGDTATFAQPLPDRVGVGDALQYDADGNGLVDALAFVHARLDSRRLTVKNAAGAAPVPTQAADTHWSLFRAYTSLVYAEHGTENAGLDPALRNFDTWSSGKDLVASNETWNLACYGDAADTSYVLVQNWTTGSANYLRIFAPQRPDEVGVSQRHAGVWTPGAYRLEVTDSDALTLIVDHVRLEGLQIHIVADPSGGACCVWVHCPGTAADVRISHSLLRGAADNTQAWHSGIAVWDAGGGTLRLWNNIFYDFTGHSLAEALDLDDGEFAAVVYNNTVQNSYIGLWNENGTLTAVNNLAQNCLDGFSGDYTPGSDYNLSDLPGDAPGIHARNATGVLFADPVQDDFHLAGVDAGARDGGADLSADAALAFADDVDGQARTAPWDIGADEYAPPATPTPTPAAAPAGGLSLRVEHAVVRISRGEHARILLQVTRPGPASLEVFDLTGRRVATLLRRQLEPGIHEVLWDGAGEGSGLYTVVFGAEGRRCLKKIVLAR